MTTTRTTQTAPNKELSVGLAESPWVWTVCVPALPLSRQGFTITLLQFRITILQFTTTLSRLHSHFSFFFFYQGPVDGGWFQTGGVSQSGLVLPFVSLSFLGFLIFPGFSWYVRGLCGDFPDLFFPLSRHCNSTYEKQSRKGPRHNPDLSRKKWGTPPPPVWKPTASPSPNFEILKQDCAYTSIFWMRSIPCVTTWLPI